MARQCEICDKRASVGNVRKLLRGHYNITAKRRFAPNLQNTTYRGQRVLACVQCIRTETRRGAIKAAAATPVAASSPAALPAKQ